MRRLSLPHSLAVWGVVALVVWLDAAYPLGVEVTGAFSFGLLVTGIVAVFKEIGKAAASTAVLIARVAVMIGVALARFGIQLAVVFARVASLLVRFWSGALRPLLAFLGRQFDRFVGWLQRTWGPVLEFLNKVRKEIDRLYTRYVKPILDTIEIARRTLQLLARLHVPFAKELDAKLAQLEDRLLAPIREVYARLNEAMNWINRIITLDGYLQQITLIRSLIRYQRDALKVWWTSVHRPLAGEQKDEYERPLKTRSLAAVAADARAYVEHRGGPDQSRIDEHVKDLELRLRAAGGAI